VDDALVRLAFPGRIERSLARHVLGLVVLMVGLGSSMVALAGTVAPGASPAFIAGRTLLAVALAIGGVLVSSSLESTRRRVVLLDNGDVELRYPWPLSFLRRRYERPFHHLRISHRFYKCDGVDQQEDVLGIAMSDGRQIFIDSEDSFPCPADRLRRRAREVAAALKTYTLEDLTGRSPLWIDLREVAER
jgi:hypothetical protein